MTTASLEAPRAKKNRSAQGGSKPKDPWGSPAVYFIALVVVALTVAPVAYIVLGGFRDNSQITVDPAGFPSPWRPETYAHILQSSSFWHQFLNSTIAALFTAVLVIALGLSASYVLARYKFRGRGLMFGLFAAGLMFPITVAITPLFILLNNLHLTNSLIGVILPQVAFGLPTTIIILVPFLQAIPEEIEEAAAVDGCSRLRFYFKMVLPLSLPGVLTTGILTFVASWNSYLLPLFVLSDTNSFTLPLGVQQFRGVHGSDTAAVLAFTSLSMIPALLFFTAFERRIVGGLQGAVKG
ncbi:carbohydrate ABC transporter permease [Nocardioides nematodiphilus]|uniref:carbohydrate ABC transporter permease n=1 Tax=Nocardioides nematodiphilus TaxID=2849669 RepID=UPI001CD969E7|nr:carbohydrate ABC transporter permease [Nocardioides nematodiphilus]MCA1981960.1 carbohydrate ABC transporter permease [Nocardioides nematodiphilus]